MRQKSVCKLSLKRDLFSLIFIVLTSGLVLGRNRNSAHAAGFDFPFRNVSLSFEERVEDLVGRLTLDEMVSMLALGGGDTYKPSPAIERLGVKPYQFDTECLAGVIGSNCTAFPMSVGMAATFSPGTVQKIAEVISTEMRGRANDATARGEYTDMYGMSCLSPFINLVRHPLWGRIVEVFGEDPFLSGQTAASYVKGLQGTHPRYVRISAQCKTVTAYAGPENIPVSRFSFDAKVTERDLRLTYLANMKMCVEAGAFSVMCSLNSINGVPACANKYILNDIIRDEYGFKGYYMSDMGAVEAIQTSHKYVKTPIDAASAAINAGVNMELPPYKPVYSLLPEAVKLGKVSLNTIKDSVRPLIYTRMRLGDFDPLDMNPYTAIPPSVIQSEEHREFAIEAASKTYVLLKKKKVPTATLR